MSKSRLDKELKSMKERVSFSFELKGKRARTQVHPLAKIMHRVPSLGLHAE